MIANRFARGAGQGIYLCEFDGPRTRNVHVEVTGSGDRG